MDRWPAELLEFEQLRDILRRYIVSPLGRALLDELAPTSDRALAEERLQEAAEALYFLDRARSAKSGAPVRLRFSDLPDCAEAAAKVRIEGAVLDGVELQELLTVLSRAMEAKSALEHQGRRLAAIVTGLADCRAVLHSLDGMLLPDGTLADDASPALARLRRELVRQRTAIQESLDRFVKAHQDEGLLQENYVTVRNDRFVVPVIASRRGLVQGVIHGASGSGQTMFVEPLETIEHNNRLVQIQEEEARETHRILREMTGRLRELGPVIPMALDVLARLELIFGKAEFAVAFDCVIPQFSPPGKRRLAIESARHPLLADVLRRQKKPIVPVSLELDESARTLLITGPNTGGKTVAMKTVGLFALMAQAGVPLPCASAELPVFDEVLADIGDQQSIAESLSSFSAHATRIGQILDGATRESLVILDELGRATDPEEGGALGVAVVDRLRRLGAFTLASTHLMALKVYGATAPGVVNGSMGFDEETLTPTYQLRFGAPGRSAGLAIAGRLGLPADLIAQARERMASNTRDVADFLAELHRKLDSVTWLESDWKRRSAELDKRAEEQAAEWARKREQGLRDLERKAADLIADFEERSRQAMEEIRQKAEQRKAAEQAQLSASRAVRGMKETLQAAVQPAAASTPARKIEEGARVRIQGVREPARVKRLLGGGKVEVEAGFLKLQVPEADVLEVLPPGEAGAKLPKGVSFSAGPSWTLSEREVNVIGRTAEEAREEIDRFIDRASLASVDRIRIVHGHGMGVLKRMVAEMLGKHPLVDRVEAASQGEGGSGATIAWLRA